MTDKQSQFCDEYLKDFNATQAAIRAGYSSTTAYSIGNENLRKPEIKNHIESKKMEISKNNNISIVSLIEDVALIKEKCIHEKFDPNNALKACDLLSKFLIQYDLKQKEFISRLSDSELESLARTLLLKNTIE